jgi:hypothetical protein
MHIKDIDSYMLSHPVDITPAQNIDGAAEHNGGLVCPYRGAAEYVSLDNIKDKH